MTRLHNLDELGWLPGDAGKRLLHLLHKAA